MPLAFDFGNSSVKIGLFSEEGILPEKEFSFKYNGELNNFKTFINEFNGRTKAIFSSVIRNNEFLILIKKRFDNCLALNFDLILPLKIDYKTPETLGKDRIAACVGAMTIFKERPLLVIDAGTCITYDFINEQNIYIGGAISPGIDMKLRAMHEFTGKLPIAYLTPDYQPFKPQKTTKTCLLEGAIAGTIHEISGVVATFGLNKTLKVVITGGSGEYLADKIENSTFAAPNLVLVGLQQIRTFNAN